MEHNIDEDDDDDERFNLCESAANYDYWDIVKLAWDHGCSCSDSIKLEYTQHQLQFQSTQHQLQLKDLQSQLLATQQQLESAQLQLQRYQIPASDTSNGST